MIVDQELQFGNTLNRPDEADSNKYRQPPENELVKQAFRLELRHYAAMLQHSFKIYRYYIAPIILLAGVLGGFYFHAAQAEAYNRVYTVEGKTYFPLARADGYRQRGIASWYGAESEGLTSMGKRFRPQGLSAAHKTLPLPCKVKVTNLRNGRSIVLMVNDRGPFIKDRIIDLSYGAAQVIGLRGTDAVEVAAI